MDFCAAIESNDEDSFEDIAMIMSTLDNMTSDGVADIFEDDSELGASGYV